MASSADLKDIFRAARPLIEQQLDLAEMVAALRDVATEKGLDWSQIKALLKAQIQDERDDNDGKRVKAIVAKAEHASAYADMLGLAKMNEENFSATHSYAEEKGRGAGERLIDAAREMRGMVSDLTDEQKAAALAYDGEDSPVGELTDNQTSEPCLGRATEHSAYVGTAPDENPTQDDVGATASSTNSAHKPAGDLAADNGDKDRGSFPAGGPVHSHSPAAIPLGAANSAGEAPSSSQASPATDTDDDGDDDVPAFIKQNKPDCLKLKDGHCRLSFATSALCAECNQRRAMARALV